MGIDNSTKLIFGLVLSEEDILKIEEKIQDDYLWDGEYMIEEFPQIFLGNSSSYYDCSEEDRPHFISLIDPSNTELTIKEIQGMTDLTSIYSKVLDYFGIKYSEPKLISLVHVW